MTGYKYPIAEHALAQDDPVIEIHELGQSIQKVDNDVVIEILETIQLEDYQNQIKLDKTDAEENSQEKRRRGRPSKKAEFSNKATKRELD